MNPSFLTAIEDEKSKTPFTFTEAIFPGVDTCVELKEILTSFESKFQQVEVIKTSFGKMLVTDGKTQSTQMDEFVYHESLVHPPLIKAAFASEQGRGPKSVFIGGGGELATAREVLRHASVEDVVMVDLDAKVLEVCKMHLPEWGGEEVANNPRMELIIGDAYDYLKNCSKKFDVIIMDISDPIEAGPGIMLYTQEFYQHADTLLNPNGVFVTQGGVGDGNFIIDNVAPGSESDTSSYAAITNTLNSVFDCVIPYSVNVPSFGTDWGYVMAFNSPEDGASAIQEFTDVPPRKINDMIDECISETKDGISKVGKTIRGSDILKYYDGLSHRRMFALPKPLRQRMKMDTRIMTKENPVFMY